MKKWKKSLSQSALSLFFYQDINECRQNVCRPDQHCKNTRGGYKCIDLCPNGMTKAENGTCIGECLAISVTEIRLLSTSQIRHPCLKLMIRINFIQQRNIFFYRFFYYQLLVWLSSEVPASWLYQEMKAHPRNLGHFELPWITLLVYIV